MADDKQLNILSQGTEPWNAWRKEHAEVSIDLTNANLRHLNLEKDINPIAITPILRD